MFTIPHVTLHNYLNALMHESEPKVDPTLINHVIMVYELRVRTIGTHMSIASFKIQFWSWFNISLEIINYILASYVNNNETKLESMRYYPLHANSPQINVHNLIKKCHYLSRLHLQLLSYKSHSMINWHSVLALRSIYQI